MTDGAKANPNQPTSSSADYASNAIVVNLRQKGNPILKHLRNVVWTYGDASTKNQPDYLMLPKVGVLFLSLKFHRLQPDYIHDRLKVLPRKFPLLVILAMVDVEDSQHLLRDLNKISILANCTLMLAWSYEEAARYLEIYKMYENKSPDLIMGKTVHQDDRSRAIDFLTTVKSINRTDAMMLIANFGCLRKVVLANEEELAACTGIGALKARNLYETFRDNFV